MLKKITIVMGMVMAAGVAQAGNGYIGASAASLKYSDSELNGDANLSMAYVRLGGYFNDYFSGEVRWGLGFGDETTTVKNDPSTKVKVDLEDMLGAYLRGGFHATDSLYPYAIVGVTRVQTTYLGMGSEQASDFSYGVGADWKISDNMSISMEYMNYFEKNINYFDTENVKVSGFSVGILGRF